jgi:FlaA1/EpsC-like NDP-sugar epimerase
MQAKADLLPARAKVSVGLRPILMLRAVRAVLDVGAWALATLGAWLLHYDGAVATELWPMMLATLAVFGLLKLAATLVFKVNRQSWEKFGFRDAANIVVAIGAVVVVALLLLLTVGSGVGVPLAIPVIDGMLTVLFMLGARGFARYLNEVRVLHRAPGRRLRRIVLAREMLRHPETGMRPVGFIDEDPHKAGRTIATVPVLGRLDDLSGCSRTSRRRRGAHHHPLGRRAHHPHIVERSAAPIRTCRTAPCRRCTSC